MEQIQCKESSNVGWARYDAGTLVLEIDFRNTRTGEKASTYAYDGFSQDDWQAFCAASSKGKHFAYHIRPRFKGRKL